MARGGARPGAGRPARKSANTSTVSRRARARARGDSWLAPDGARQLVVMWRDIEYLIPYARNARTHSDAQIAQIAGSIREFGFTNPVLIDEKGGIIAGHGRVLGARQLGMTLVPTITLTGLTEAQRRAYVIADNKLALNAGWDPEMLRLELGELKLGGFDLSLTGFGDLELAGIMAERTEGLTDPDDTPVAPEHPVSQTGDLWLLGQHRIICGDCCAILPTLEVDAVITDPPYGINTRSDGSGKLNPWADLCNSAFWYADWLGLCRATLTRGGPLWTFLNWRSVVTFQKASCDINWPIESLLIWDKCWIGPGGPRGLRPSYEMVALFIAGNFAIKDRGLPDIQRWPVGSNKPNGHPAEKPLEAMLWIVENSGPGTILDPFLGSGTTCIAAEKLGREFIGIEISPAYVDVAVKRWQHFTGKAATLDGDGRTFSDIAADRQPQTVDAA